MEIKHWVILVFLFILSVSGFSQTLLYDFENIGIEQGLSQSSALSALQDKKGFIWFGTQDGLNRYDGYRFKVFRPDLDRPNSSITEGSINIIKQDHSGNILIAYSTSGFDLYDPIKDCFINFKHQDKNRNSICCDNVQDFYIDCKDDIWAISDNGTSCIHFPIAHRFDSAIISHTNTFMGKPYSFFSHNKDLIIEDRKGNYLFKNKGEYYYVLKKNIDFNKLTFENLPQYSIHFPLEKDKIIKAGIDRNKNIWFVYANRMEKIIDAEKNTRQVIRFRKELHFDQRSNLFVGSDSCLYFILDNNGIFAFQTKTGDTCHIKHEAGKTKSLFADDVTDVVEDQNGIIWFATRDGISKYNSKKTNFRHFDVKPGDPNWLNDRWPFAFTEDKYGHLWVGTYQGNGIYVYDKQKNRFEMISPSKFPGALKGANDILSLFKDHKDMVWVGSYGNGLGYYMDKTKSFKFYHADSTRANALVDNVVNWIDEDHKGNLWIATSRGLSKFDRGTETFTNYFPCGKPKPTDANKRNSIMSVMVAKDGTIWLGMEFNGMFKLTFKPSGEPIFKQYLSKRADPSSLNSNQIFSVQESFDHKLWIGTNGQGLNLFDPKTEKAKHFTVKDGLSNNVVYGVLTDKKERVWISTNMGLSMFDPKTEKFKNYTVSQGLQSNEFNQGAYFKDREGQMYFGGVRGYNIFDPTNIQQDSSHAKVIFTDFKLFNTSVAPGKGSPLQQSISFADKITLSYQQRDFTFEFAATHYASPTENQFAYKIEGYHDEWVQLGYNHSVSFTSFPPGEYVLKVKAANADGVWGNEYASIDIIILPPFWKTSAFYIFEFLMLILCIAFFIKYREKKLICEKEMLEQKINERTQTIREQNEELKVQKEEILAQTEELETINEQLEKLSLVASKTDNAVIIMNFNGNFEWVNEGFTKLYGFNYSEYVSLNGLNIRQNSHHPDIETIFYSCSKERRTVSYESRNITKSGEVKWAQTTLTPIVNDANEIIKVVAIDSDISKLKLAEERINDQNKQITDSIQYASRIQSAIMPPQELMEELFPSSFILFQPRDIVSGDFFWASTFWSEASDSKQIIIAVADCTGHGVPGAFMSMLGIAFLNEIVNGSSKLEMTAAAILEALRDMIIKSLHQTGRSKENKDGMDISLCVLDMEHNALQFAGANNSLLIARNNELLELKADKMPVGIYMGEEKKFTNHLFTLQKGDLLYLFSDGFQDQFGGPTGRKFLKKNFKELLLNISHLKLSEQKEVLRSKLDDWRTYEGKQTDQLDDITVLGLQI